MPARRPRSRERGVVEIQGVRYFTLDEVVTAVARTRQTIWRWRRDGQIPAGHRDRKGRVLFTAPDVEAIRSYALQVEPIKSEGDQQLRLFNNNGHNGLSRDSA